MFIKLLIFLIVFIVAFITYYLFVIRREKYLDKFIKGKEISYLKKVYKLKIKSSDYKNIAIIVSGANSFIIATTLFIISFFKYFFFQIIVGFITVIALILLIYHIIGKILQKKWR